MIRFLVRPTTRSSVVPRSVYYLVFSRISFIFSYAHFCFLIRLRVLRCILSVLWSTLNRTSTCPRVPSSPEKRKKKRKRGEWREEERKTSSHCLPTANVPYCVIYHTQLQTKVGSDAKDECNTIMYRAMVAQVSPPSHLRYSIFRLESLDRTCKHPKIDIGAVAVAAVGRWAYGGELRIIRNQISTPVFFSFSPNLNSVLCFQTILMYAVH